MEVIFQEYDHQYIARWGIKRYSRALEILLGPIMWSFNGGSFRGHSGVVQGPFKGCSRAAQWPFKGCSSVVQGQIKGRSRQIF
jgi:hypothetical protein